MDESESLRDLLVRGVAAAKAGSKEEARFFLEWALRTASSEEAKVDAWWWLSQVARDTAEARRCLEEVLARQPSHPQARRALAVADGRLAPSEIVDPDRLPAAPAADAAGVAQRFACPRCGGRLAASADALWLNCSYCGWRRSIETGEAALEQDFVVAMATARGHRRPQRTRTFHCRGCGAPFMLSPEMLSLTCPYCASAHVVEHAESEDLVPPDGVLPFGEIEPREAAGRGLGDSAPVVDTWLGLYLPLWSFDLSGEILWRGVREEHHGQGRETVTGSFPVLERDHLVPATRRLPEKWARAALVYSCKSLRPFRLEALADWPAETYQIPMSDAAVEAHAEVFARVRERARAEVPPDIRDLRFDSTRFTFDSFRLILAPVWLGLSGRPVPRPIVVLNGQSGAAAAERDR
jgi:DNA-directed RNA polymerase subunit RPC12/RpoP